jgi:hypothetical protein
MSSSVRAERDKWDNNRDGFLDSSEFRSYFEGRVQQTMQERGLGSSSDRSGDNSRGGSGYFGGFLPPVYEEEDKKPVVYRAGKLPKDLPSWFAQLDSDEDAQIGLYEWRNSRRPLDDFQGMDRNGDGFLTVEEVLRLNQSDSARTADGRGDSERGRDFPRGMMFGAPGAGGPGSMMFGNGNGSFRMTTPGGGEIRIQSSSGGMPSMGREGSGMSPWMGREGGSMSPWMGRDGGGMNRRGGPGGFGGFGGMPFGGMHFGGRDGSSFRGRDGGRDGERGRGGDSDRGKGGDMRDRFRRGKS